MAYCRKGEGSDVYIWTDGTLIHCDGCLLQPLGVQYATLSPMDMYQHAKEHEAAGHVVPQSALSRLLDEIANEP